MIIRPSLASCGPISGSTVRQQTDLTGSSLSRALSPIFTSQHLPIKSRQLHILVLPIDKAELCPAC